MKKATKYFSLFFAALLMIPIFGVSLSAHEEKNIGAEEAVLKTPAYRSQVEKMTNNIIKKDGLYQIDTNKLDLTKIDSELLEKTEKILNYMNNDEKIINVINTLNEKEGKQLANFSSSFNADTFGFGNSYWWGYAYTFTNADLQWAASISIEVGQFIYTLASVVPVAYIQSVMSILGVVLTAVGTVLQLINAKFLTVNILQGGVVGIPSFELNW